MRAVAIVALLALAGCATQPTQPTPAPERGLARGGQAWPTPTPMPARETIELVEPAGTGAAAFDAMGVSVCVPGDLNGDGIDDTAIAATGASGNAGEVSIYFGNANTEAIPTADASFIGTDGNTRAGNQLAPAGDVNGDGLADLLVWEPFGNNNRGALYVIYGKASGWASNVSLSQADVSVSSNDVYLTAMGESGDVNGDGYSDLILGSVTAEGYKGATYVLFGAADLAGNLNAVADASLTYVGVKAGDRSGGNVACVGDVNGDNKADIAISAPFASPNGALQAGVVYLVLGGDTPGSYSLTNADATINGIQRRASYGETLSAAGDINNDGLGDFIVGTPNAYGTSLDSGVSCLFYGRTNGWGDLNDENDADVRFLGEGNESGSGNAFAYGDANGDGQTDLVIASAEHDAVKADQGKVYVFFGGQTLGAEIDLGDAAASFVGYTKYLLLGSDVAMGDTNGDGVDDLVIGAYGWKPGSEEYNTGAWYNWPMRAAGDLNGDGHVSNLDALVSQAVVHGYRVPSRVYPAGAVWRHDLDRDGVITSADTDLIWRARE
jgi:hypothetical protein